MLTAKGNSYGTAGTPPTISGWIGGKLPRNRTRSGSLGTTRPWPDVGHFKSLTQVSFAYQLDQARDHVTFDTWSTCPEIKSSWIKFTWMENRNESQNNCELHFYLKHSGLNLSNQHPVSTVLTRDNERPKWNENKGSVVIIRWPIKIAPADKENSRGKSTGINLSSGHLTRFVHNCQVRYTNRSTENVFWIFAKCIK